MAAPSFSMSNIKTFSPESVNILEARGNDPVVQNGFRAVSNTSYTSESSVESEATVYIPDDLESIETLQFLEFKPETARIIWDALMQDKLDRPPRAHILSQAKHTLQNLFPGVPPVIVDYEPRYSQEAQVSTSAGKILFQYDPYGALVPETHADPQDPCKVYQQATFRLWAEDSPDPIFSNNWAAEGNQLITDFATYFSNHPQRKRDNAPACSIPSSLLQASTESGSQPNMSPSSAPDPDSTFFATLPPPSSTSPPSSSTPPPPTTSAPPPITSPPPAPSGEVSCGSDSPKLSPASVSHLMVNFCQGNADYDPGAPTIDSAQPMADLSDIPDDQKELPVLNNLYATLIIARPDCATATFGFSASSSLCQGYIESITASCTQGGGVLTSAGCFDFGVKAYTAGRGHAQW